MVAGEPGIWADDVPNGSPGLIIVSICFMIITTFFFTFRQGWRWAHRQRGMDDVMAACAYILLLIQTIFGGVSAHYGFGKHIQVIKPTYRTALEYFYMYQICYKLIGGFTKLTFCFLYLRIFNQKFFHRLTYAIMAIVSLGSLAFALGTVFQCIPVRKAWDRTVPGHCLNNTRFWYTHAAFNIIFDIVVFVMPIPLIRTLKLAQGQKIGLISIFSLGAFVIAAAIVRMVMLRSSAGSTDPTWGSTIALTWTEIEANVSVICCCLPALRVPLLNGWHWLRGNRKPSETEPPMKQRYPATGETWSGPQRTEAAVAHPMSKQQTLHNLNIAGAAQDSGDRSRHTTSTTSKSATHWFDRMLSRVDKEPDSEHSLSSSQVELSRVEKGMSVEAGPAFGEQFGGISRVTDIHVSTRDINSRRHFELVPSEIGDEERQLSLKDVLNER